MTTLSLSVTYYTPKKKKKDANERTRIWRLMAGNVVYSVGRKSA